MTRKKRDRRVCTIINHIMDTSPSSKKAKESLSAKYPCIRCKKGAPLRCAACLSRYCSAECQKDDWESHREKCRKLVSGKRTLYVVLKLGGEGDINVFYDLAIAKASIEEDMGDRVYHETFSVQGSPKTVFVVMAGDRGCIAEVFAIFKEEEEAKMAAKTFEGDDEMSWWYDKVTISC